MRTVLILTGLGLLALTIVACVGATRPADEAPPAARPSNVHAEHVEKAEHVDVAPIVVDRPVSKAPVELVLELPPPRPHSEVLQKPIRSVFEEPGVGQGQGLRYQFYSRAGPRLHKSIN